MVDLFDYNDDREKLNNGEKKIVEYWGKVLKENSGRLKFYSGAKSYDGSSIVCDREIEFPEIQYEIYISWPEDDEIWIRKEKRVKYLFFFSKKRHETVMEIKEKITPHFFRVLYRLFRERIKLLEEQRNERMTKQQEEGKKREMAKGRKKSQESIDEFLKER